MTHREKVLRVLRRETDAESVLWTGSMKQEVVDKFAREFGIDNDVESLRRFFDDDCRYIPADLGYKHPDGRWLWDYEWGIGKRKTLSAPGCFAEADSMSDIADYPWPDVKYFDFDSVYREIEKYSDYMVFTGVWSPFFHTLSGFLGMENYFIKMYENPEFIEQLTNRIVDFYVEANDQFFAGLGDRADVMFFGNDFGTQRGLIVSPECFRRFMLPSIKRLVQVGKKYGKHIMMHSCGSIYEIIPDLIEAGIEMLNPLQAAAEGMSAENLNKYRDKLIFVGGIDAQSFIVNATPDEIKAEVKRVSSILGPGYIVSPSHEEILPNIPPQNILAMAQAAHGV